MSQIVVGQQTGYARNASESANPNLWRGLVGWWCPSVHFRGGQRLLDLSQQRNYATLNNMTNDDWLVSRGYGALDLDGTDDYLTAQAGLSTPRQLSLSFWVKLDSHPRSIND